MKLFLKISLWIILLAGAIFLLGFVKKEQSEVQIWDFKVKVEEKDQVSFVNENMIKDQIREAGIVVLDMPTEELDLNSIQEIINKNPSVKSSSVYKTLDGQLHAVVDQREPIARIFNPNGTSYYLDREGYLMPLSEAYTARLTVVTGAFNFLPNGWSMSEIQNNKNMKDSLLRDDLYQLVLAIEKDPFMKALVDEIGINKNSEFDIYPRLGSQKITLGDAHDLEIKFKKLKAFYKEIVNINRLDQYREINLKYRDQVVCTKY